ncbi:MAG TPA: glycoside hydrolase family 16 protein [Candidatus Sulfotelmatobacter sp.]|nr:glycoside hydrolase family 16 protein [Candidatus Sulfotelmatobacter sp.]
MNNQRRNLFFVYSKAVFLTALLALACVFHSSNASGTPPPGYYEVWGDEFNGNGLDLTKWYYYNQVSQQAVDTLSAITVTNGYLTINTYTTNGINYTGIIGSNFRSFEGYYEASISFVDTNSTWSAFWLQSPTVGEFIGDPSASGAEIDVAEHRYVDGTDDAVIWDSVQETLHWDGYGGQEQTVNAGQQGSGLNVGFHTYSLLWTPTNYEYGIDGTIDLSTNTGHSDRTEVVMLSVQSQTPSWAGSQPGGGFGPLGVSPVQTTVDYVRYYAPPQMLFWTGAESSDWTDTNNWFDGIAISTTNDVVFSELSGNNFNMPLTQPAMVNSLNFQETPAIDISGSSLTIGSGGINMLSALNSSTIDSPVIVPVNQAWKTGPGTQLTFNNQINGPGTVTIAGRGTVAITATNSAAINLTNGLLSISGEDDGAVTMTGGTLAGTGLFTGPFQVNGGNVNVNLGQTMIISNSMSLQGNGTLNFTVDAANNSSGNISGVSSLSYGGILVLNNIAGTFSATNSFKLFNAGSYVGTFGSYVPATPGYDLAWDLSALYSGILRIKAVVPVATTNVVESRSGNSTTGANNPAFSYTGFSSTISATFSTAPGCTATSSRFSNTAQPTTAFSVTPTLLVGPTYSVDVTWGRNTGTSMEANNLIIAPSATGVSATTFPATTAAFSSGPGNTTNSVWKNIGTITPTTTSPTVTFTYVSGMGTGRFYATAVRFTSVLPAPGTMAAGMIGTNLVINWSGNFTLQSATNVAGPYVDLPGPVIIGPYTNAMTGGQQYFRLHN